MEEGSSNTVMHAEGLCRELSRSSDVCLCNTGAFRLVQAQADPYCVIDCQMPLEGKILIVCIHHVGHQHYSTPMWWRALPWYVFSSLMKNGLWFGMLFSLVSTQVLLFNTGASPHSNVSICFFFFLHCNVTASLPQARATHLPDEKGWKWLNRTGWPSTWYYNFKIDLSSDSSPVRACCNLVPPHSNRTKDARVQPLVPW